MHVLFWYTMLSCTYLETVFFCGRFFCFYKSNYVYILFGLICVTVNTSHFDLTFKTDVFVLIHLIISTLYKPKYVKFKTV